MKSKLLLGAGSAAIAVLLILTLALATSGMVSAQTPTSSPDTAPGTTTSPVAPAAGSPVYRNGKVSTVSATSIVLATGKGNITANISSNTYVVVKRTAPLPPARQPTSLSAKMQMSWDRQPLMPPLSTPG